MLGAIAVLPTGTEADFVNTEPLRSYQLSLWLRNHGESAVQSRPQPGAKNGLHASANNDNVCGIGLPHDPFYVRVPRCDQCSRYVSRFEPPAPRPVDRRDASIDKPDTSFLHQCKERQFGRHTVLERAARNQKFPKARCLRARVATAVEQLPELARPLVSGNRCRKYSRLSVPEAVHEANEFSRVGKRQAIRLDVDGQLVVGRENVRLCQQQDSNMAGAPELSESFNRTSHTQRLRRLAGLTRDGVVAGPQLIHLRGRLTACASGG